MGTTVDEGVQEVDIRTCLVNGLSRRFEDDSDTLIVEEFGLCQGDARIDLAVINGSLYGYEIKSEKDTLRRLERQLEIYGKVLDSVMMVVSPRHLAEVERMTPDWCGISRVEWVETQIGITEVRPMTENRNVDVNSLVQLLWRAEALNILECRNLAGGLRNKSRAVLWKKITDNLSLADLREEVRKKIKSRPKWRVAGQLKTCGD